MFPPEVELFDHFFNGQSLYNNGEYNDHIGDGEDEIPRHVRAQRQGQGNRDTAAQAAPGHDPVGSRNEFQPFAEKFDRQGQGGETGQQYQRNTKKSNQYVRTFKVQDGDLQADEYK